MKAHRRVVSAALSVPPVAAQTVLHPTAARLRAERGMSAVLLAVRGGARYASKAPRLFASAGEHREQLRNDLALQTAELHQHAFHRAQGRRHVLGRLQRQVVP